MAHSGGLSDLDLTADEVERLRRAFRDQRFRELFAEFAAELSDPEQYLLYQQEVTALELERGVEVKFVHPKPGFVLRTSQDGSRCCYINVCSNELMGEPRARAEPGGQRWELPYSLAPGRQLLRRAGRSRFVYDVVFHPATLDLARRSPRFLRLLCDTALEAVERHCAVRLDRNNSTVLKGVSYKGVPQAPVIRSPLPGGAPKPPDGGESPLPPFPFPPAAAPPPAAGGSSPAAAPPPPGPTTPRWSIRHRSYVDLQDYRHCRRSAPSPAPRELVVTVELPLLRSAGQAELEIRRRELLLESRSPAYRLRLPLPYDVDESRGRAVFNRNRRNLEVTLPVVLPPGPREPRSLDGDVPEGAEPAAEGPGGAGPAEAGPAEGEPAGAGLAEAGPAEAGPAETGAGPAEAGPAEEGGGAAPPPELGAGGAARSTCGGAEPGDALAEPLAEALCDPPAAPSAQPLAEAAAELPVEPLCDPPAEPATDPTSEPSAGPTTAPSSEPFTDPAAEPPTEPAAPPLPCSGAAAPIASPQPAMPTGDTPPEASEGQPSDVATCPPFRARQDEASLTLLLLVPGIRPQSFRGDVGAHHYGLRFCTDTAAYALVLLFPPAAALLCPESSVSISAHNAVVGLAKAPGSTGLWDKFSFGLDPSSLQERLFVSEENVDGFLGTAFCPSPCSQSALERQPLIEVLDVTEDRIQIRVEPQERAGEGTLGSSGGKTDGNRPETETKAETKCPAAEARAAGSSPAPAAATIGRAGRASHHCLQHEPPAAASAVPGGAGRERPDLESAAAAAPAPGCGKGEAQGGEDEEAAPGSRAGSPVLREVNPEDGSVRILRQHRTRCPVALQSPLLYELD